MVHQEILNNSTHKAKSKIWLKKKERIGEKKSRLKTGVLDRLKEKLAYNKSIIKLKRINRRGLKNLSQSHELCRKGAHYMI